MESVNKQATAGINWAEWSRVVEAAQDPRHRDVVQRFLAQAELSAEVPAAIDAKILAPRRSEGATGEQCAYILCNLGFASLVTGTQGAAEFAKACGRLVERLGPDTPDLALRRLFLSTKGELITAVLTDQPHLFWGDVGERCTAYLRALNDCLDALPGESIEHNAMAAFSFAAQFLSRIHDMHAVERYADEISQLVAAALSLANQLLPAFVSRMWNNLLPGKDAAVMFRQVGALAELSLQPDEPSAGHATTGLAYLDDILAQHASRSAPDRDRALLTRAQLLLLSGRETEALEQALSFEDADDSSVRGMAIAIAARCKLEVADPQAAANLLAQVAPTTDQVLQSWRAAWMGDTDGEIWAQQPDAFSSPQDKQNIWRLQAVAAAELRDLSGFTQAANRCTGFLVDSLLHDRQRWVERNPQASDVQPETVLDEIFESLSDGSALLQVVKTDEGILTWVARKQNGRTTQFIAPDRPDVKRLLHLHKTWSRAYFDSRRNGTASLQDAPDISAAFSALMDEMDRNWSALLLELLDDGVTQLILVGDDLVDLPFHATRTGAGDERLLDRVPVTYAPSLRTLRACLDRTPIDPSKRTGVELVGLVEAGLDDGDAVAAILETKRCKPAPPVDEAFWKQVAAARVLHIAARASHVARRPMDSLIGAGSLDLSFGELLASLDLTQCDVVSNVHGESVLPSTLRAPGLDLAALFLAAGARSVLASTWCTKDELASELTRLFFRNWSAGQAPSSALREASLQLRSERPALADFHWAGMRLVGAP